MAIAAQAADKVHLVTSWFAEPELGRFSEAKAEGRYEKAGLLHARFVRDLDSH